MLAVGLVAIATIGCATIECRAAPATAVIRIAHISGGDVPIVTRLQLYEDGLVELQEIGHRKRCARDDTALIERIRSATSIPAFTEEVSAIAADRAKYAPADWEQLIVEVDGQERFWIAIEKEPPGIIGVLEKVDYAFRKSFGSAYRVSLARGSG